MKADDGHFGACRGHSALSSVGREEIFRDKGDVSILLRQRKTEVKKEMGYIVMNLYTWKWKPTFGILATLIANLVILDKILNLSELSLSSFRITSGDGNSMS